MVTTKAILITIYGKTMTTKNSIITTSNLINQAKTKPNHLMQVLGKLMDQNQKTPQMYNLVNLLLHLNRTIIQMARIYLKLIPKIKVFPVQEIVLIK